MSDLKTGSNLVPTARLEGAAVIASVKGDIDLHNSPEFRDALLELLATAKPRNLVLNMCQVQYMDSSAIAVLVESLRKLRVGGGKLFLVAPQARIRSVLETARLDSIFKIVATEAEAVEIQNPKPEIRNKSE
jgi:anti-sigma B factor antagonist